MHLHGNIAYHCYDFVSRLLDLVHMGVIRSSVTPAVLLCTHLAKMGPAPSLALISGILNDGEKACSMVKENHLSTVAAHKHRPAGWLDGARCEMPGNPLQLSRRSIWLFACSQLACESLQTIFAMTNKCCVAQSKSIFLTIFSVCCCRI